MILTPPEILTYYGNVYILHSQYKYFAEMVGLNDTWSYYSKRKIEKKYETKLLIKEFVHHPT